MTPPRGRQSTMERPEPVRRTAPPSTTRENTSRQQIHSHVRTGASAAAGGLCARPGGVEVIRPSV